MYPDHLHATYTSEKRKGTALDTHQCGAYEMVYSLPHNSDNALEYLLRSMIPLILGTFYNYDSHRGDDHVYELKLQWSTHYLWANSSRCENPIHDPGLTLIPASTSRRSKGQSITSCNYPKSSTAAYICLITLCL